MKTTHALLVMSLSLAALPAAADPGEDARFDRLVDQYYTEWIQENPTTATSLGLHAHDGKLEDWSPRGLGRAKKRARAWEERFAAIAEDRLSPERAIDLLQLRGAIAAKRLTLERVRAFERYPSQYSRLAARTIYNLIKRSFAPAEERLRSVIERERRIPAMLAAGQKNLRDVPRISADIALRELPPTIAFFEKDVPLAFAEVKDPKLRSAFATANAQAVAALKDYQRFVTDEVLARASAPFALGEELFLAKLRAEEQVDVPLAELLARGEAELKRLQEEMKKTAARIDPRRSPEEVQRLVGADHPPPDQAIAATVGRLEGLKRFLREREIVTVPSEVLPRVQETPPFSRAVSVASMDTPGPFETRATEAYYSVTLPEPGWPKEQVEEWMENFSRPLIDVVSIHEAYPGHYVQFLWVPKVLSKVRKFEDSASNSEGWAHYCEQMMLDEGYGGDDPQLRVAQIQDALLRAARYVAGIRMHTRGMSYDEAVAFFQREGYQTRKVAEVEARRGTEDPTYLVYTLGKLEILRLREDYRKKLGAAYSLRKFHDAFLAEGPIALGLMRRALLGEGQK